MVQAFGRVVRKPFAVGSKSEREAIVLQTRSDEYVLRRHNGNPFRDPELEHLIGKAITCSGDVRGYVFIMKDWHETSCALAE